MTDLEHVTADPYQARDGSWHVHVRCPYCGKRHTHGIPQGLATGTTSRVSHCRENARTYILTVPPAEPAP